MSLNKIVKSALREDIGKRDLTTALFIPKGKKIKAVILAKESGVICGIDIARKVFQAQDKRIKFKALLKDGQGVVRGKIIATLNGEAQGILTAERVALNFLGLLSGISTRTRQFVNAVRPYKVKILDTRKTLPGLRELEKYAVRMGGGYNHRLRLDEMVLIKDNHIRIMACESSVAGLGKIIIRRMGKGLPKKTKIEIEVNNLQDFKEALKIKPDIIMLDNMKINDIRKAALLRNKLRAILATKRGGSAKYFGASYELLLEASGNINLNNIRQYAKTGVDFISIGSLTKDIQSLDLSLEVIP